MTTLLLVDDNSAFLRMYGKLLELIGFSVIGAPGRDECMQVLASERPDLILLDIMMEPHDGWDTLRSIRNNDQTMAIPVVILTGKRPTVEEIDRYGGDIEDYLMKPVRKNDLTEALDRILERIRQRDTRVDAACRGGCSPADVAGFVRLERAVRMDEKFRNLFVETNAELGERVRQRRIQLDTMRERLDIR
ncbi:MAG: response regulator PleD [Methanoregulaceae archaeon PtaB.Bin108]|nr:MAG: response regulator PleD [Methanoregulaceae archaeon PtaB.Bin108]